MNRELKKKKEESFQLSGIKIREGVALVKESVENMAKDLSSSPLQLNGVGARMYRCHHITDSTHLNVKANQASE